MPHAGSAVEPHFLNGYPHLAWSLLSGGIADFISPQWSDYTGHSTDALSGLKWLHVVHPEDRMSWLRAIDEATQDAAEFECRLRGADGHYRWFLVRGSRERHLPNEPELWIGTCTEIDSVCMRFERRIDEMEREKGRTDRFVAMLGHELRTPLVAIQTAIESIANEELSREARAAIEVAQRNDRRRERRNRLRISIHRHLPNRPGTSENVPLIRHCRRRLDPPSHPSRR